jgi:Beta-galactosidase, domain 3
LTWATFGDVSLPFSLGNLLNSPAQKDHILFYTLVGQSIEVSLEVSTAELHVAADNCNCVVTTANDVRLSCYASIGTLTSGQEVLITASPSGLSVLEIGNTVIYIADKRMALGIWSPRLVKPELTGHYALTPDVASVWVSGPYLVRTAWVEDGFVHLTGDLDTTTTIDLWGAPTITSVTWNGREVEVQRTKTGSLQGTIHFSLENKSLDLPNLAEVNWNCAESTPELADNFDDSEWTLADKTQTARQFKPYQGKVRLIPMHLSSQTS